MGVEAKGGAGFSRSGPGCCKLQRDPVPAGQTEECPSLFSPEGTAVSPQQSFQWPWGWELGWRSVPLGEAQNDAC